MAESQHAQFDVDALMEGSPLDRAIFTLLMVCALVILWRRRIRMAKHHCTNNPVLADLLSSYCGSVCCGPTFAGVAFKRWFKSLGDPLMVLVLLTEAHPALR